MRTKAMEVYKKMYGREMTPVVLHAGLECGFLGDVIPNMDAISIGPDSRSFHSPNECLSISSTKRVWNYLKELLTELG